MDLLAGSHVAVIAREKLDEVCLEGRLAGLALRDTLVVVSPVAPMFVLLFRTALSAGTVADQVVGTGTGVLDIRACRIGESKPDVKNYPFDAWRRMEGRNDRQEPEQTYNPNEGRWPSNVLLMHAPDCGAGCVPRCPIVVLGEQADFFQQFRNATEIERWLGKLIQPPS
jgi:hypothetical protein